jgi:SAM-dependent methyltransferase
VYGLLNGTEFYDIDTANIHFAQKRKAKAASRLAAKLPSSYPYTETAGTSALRYDFATVGCAAAGERPMQLDAGTQEWVETQLAAPRSIFHSIGMALLQLGGRLSDYDAQAVLDSPVVHLLSAAQWSDFLNGGGTTTQRGSVLDVGAGSGHITAAFAPLFDEVFATEISSALAWRLDRRGFRSAVQPSDGPPSPALLAAAPGFDGKMEFGTVVALNVLDRVDNSKEYLQTGLLPLVAPGGRLVIALPLPYRAKRWEHPAAASAARCAFLERKLHSRMPLVPTPARVKLEHACDQCHSSLVSADTYRYHRKLCRNAEGTAERMGDNKRVGCRHRFQRRSDVAELGRICGCCDQRVG